MGFVFKPPNIFVALSSFLFGLRRLFRDLQPYIAIASTSTAVHTPRKLEGEGPDIAQSTSIWYMFRNSKMPFGSGFVFSRIHTTELIFNQLLLSLDRSLKLIWIVSVTRNFSLTLQRLWCTKFQLGSNAFVFPSTGHYSVDMQDFFFLLKIAPNYFFFPCKRNEIGRFPGEKCLYGGWDLGFCLVELPTGTKFRIKEVYFKYTQEKLTPCVRGRLSIWSFNTSSRQISVQSKLTCWLWQNMQEK